jgi:carbamate kinase
VVVAADGWRGVEAVAGKDLAAALLAGCAGTQVAGRVSLPGATQ